jgi:hypothetical protein
LLLAIVLAGTALVVSGGATALDDTRGQLDVGRAEKALTQFDSRSAMVALGGTSRQGVELATGADDGYSVDGSVGWMNVSITDPSTTPAQTVTVVNATLGATLYENDDTVIAYQGGGVWKRTASGATMLSPPEFHFRDATLTLPIITVDGDPTLSTGATVEKGGPMAIEYPNTTANSKFVNPLANGRVNVTVHSDYYQAWGRYFEQRTGGKVWYNHTAETARTELVVPFDEDFDNLVATTASSGITTNGRHATVPSPKATGVNYPLADSRIQTKIDECEQPSSPCTPVSGSLVTASGGTYYVDGDFDDSITADTSGGNITLVVDGQFKPSAVSITGPSDRGVQVLTDGNFKVDSDVTGLYDAGQFSVIMHSGTSFDVNGNKDMKGFIYAPGSDCDMNGNANFVGGLVCETVDVNGNPNSWSYDSSVKDVDLRLDGQETRLTYLHITTNPINVTST